MSPHPAACQLCPPPPPRNAKVELGGLGCRTRISARKGGVRKGTAQAAGFGWVLGSGFRSPSYPALTLNPSIPGSPTAPPARSRWFSTPPRPTPPSFPGDRKTRGGAESGARGGKWTAAPSSPSLPLCSLTDDDLCVSAPTNVCLYSPKAFPQSSSPVAPKELGQRPD